MALPRSMPGTIIQGDIPSCGYRFPENTEGTEGAFDTYAELVQGKKVATIGHFRFIENRFEGVGELSIIERRPRDNDYPDTASEFILPDQDFVFITGSTLVNKTHLPAYSSFPKMPTSSSRDHHQPCHQSSTTTA